MITVTRNVAFSSFGVLPGLSLAVGLLLASSAAAQTPEDLFKTKCVICHTIGLGKFIGPDLKGVNERRDRAWLLPFIRDSQAVINSGDPVAVGLFKEHSNMIMPPPMISDAEIISILDFVKTSGPLRLGGATTPIVPVGPATEDQIEQGRKLFQGELHFENGGPSCIVCHDVTEDLIIGGGVLAKELTTVFERLGGPGVRAIVGSPPFPVMQRAFADEPLTEAEINAVVGFLEKVGAQQKSHMPRDTGIKLAFSGAAGTFLLLIFYSIFWRKRKQLSVNHAIYERQVKSV